jgi:hypothetical protein
MIKLNLYFFSDLKKMKMNRATLIQMNKTNLNQAMTGSVILPGILRNGQGKFSPAIPFSFFTSRNKVFASEFS